MNTIVYKYKVYPRGDQQKLIAIIQKANDFYNEHIRIERECRDEYRAERNRIFPSFAALENRCTEIRDQIDEYRKVIKSTRQQTKRRNSKKDDTDSHAEPKSQIKALLDLSKPLYEQMAAMRIEIKGGKPWVEASDEVTRLLKEKKTDGERWNREEELEIAKTNLKRVVAETPLGKKQDELNELRRSKKDEVGKLGLWFGQYALCEEAVMQASRTANGDPEFRGDKVWQTEKPGKNDPGTRIATSGRLGVGSKGGWEAPVARVLEGSDLMMSISPNPDRVGKKWQTLAFRIGTHRVDGEPVVPVWEMFDLVMHRPMPQDAVLLRACISGKKKGLGKWTWNLCVTLRTESGSITPDDGECIVDIGWTKLDDGAIRVGTVVTNQTISLTEFGKRVDKSEVIVDSPWLRKSATGYNVVIPTKYVERLKVGKELLGYSDDHFNDAMGKRKDESDVYRAFSALARRSDVPRWLEVDAESAHAWKSHDKLAPIVVRLRDKIIGERASELTSEWRNACLNNAPKLDLYTSHDDCKRWALEKGEAELVAIVFALEQWRLKDRHLRQWASGNRDRVSNARRDSFRKIARLLANSHARVTISDVNLAEAAKLEETEAEQANELHKSQRANRVVAAASEFRDAVRLAFGKERISKPKKLEADYDATGD